MYVWSSTNDERSSLLYTSEQRIVNDKSFSDPQGVAVDTMKVRLLKE